MVFRSTTSGRTLVSASYRLAPADERWLGRLTNFLHRHVFGSRSRRVIVVLVFLWVLNIFDLTVTLVNVNAGGFQEANPIAATLLHSPAHLAAYKLTLVTAASIIFIAYRRSRIAEIGCWGACLVYLALAHVWQVYHG